jgi:hypothetical protein
VAYAFVQDVAASWEQYRLYADALEGPAPAGLILHLAGPTDEGFRIIDVWESEADWEHFRTGRLVAVTDGTRAFNSPRQVVRALRPQHVVYGRREGGRR